MTKKSIEDIISETDLPVICFCRFSSCCCCCCYLLTTESMLPRMYFNIWCVFSICSHSLLQDENKYITVHFSSMTVVICKCEVCCEKEFCLSLLLKPVTPGQDTSLNDLWTWDGYDSHTEASFNCTYMHI